MDDALEKKVLAVLSKYELQVAAKAEPRTQYPGPNLEEALGRDRNFDSAFDEVLQSLQNRGFITRQADSYYRLTKSGLAYSRR